MAQGAGVERGGLGVRRQARGARGGAGRVGEHGLRVPGGVGVVGEAREVALVAAVCEGGEGAPVQLDAARPGDRRLDGEAGQLVAEADAGAALHERAAGERRLERRAVVGHERVEQVEGHAAGHDRDGVDQRAGAGRQARRRGPGRRRER